MNTILFLKVCRNIVTTLFLKVYRIILIVKVSRIIALLGLFVITIIVTYNIKCPKNEVQTADTLIVSPPITHRFSREEIKEQVKKLSGIALQIQTSNIQLFMDVEKERMQVQLSFIALFAVLLFPFLSTDKSIVRVGIVWTIFLFFICYDLYDIHTADLSYRQIYYTQSIGNALSILAKINPTDSTWYDLDNNKFIKLDSTMHAHSFYRKVGNLLHPNLSQIAFYFLPLFVLLGLYLVLSVSNDDVKDNKEKNRPL